MRPSVLAGLLLVAATVAAGFALAELAVDREGTVVTVTRTATAVTAEPAGLPEPVAAKWAAIRQAAAARDYRALARLAAPDFTYTFGSPVEGGPAAYWRQAERRGEEPLAVLAAILDMPSTLVGGIYVWPFAYDRTAEEITPYEASLLERVPSGAARIGPEGYLGWRAGIRPDGSWIYFVAGD